MAVYDFQDKEKKSELDKLFAEVRTYRSSKY